MKYQTIPDLHQWIFTYTIYLLVIPIILTTLYILKTSRKPSPSPKHPPGPTPWPIIGNIHQLGSKPHSTVTALSKKYGPIMSLKLGTLKTIVISSTDVAKEMFLRHDLEFSSRTLPNAARVANHHKHSMIWLPVGPKWRHIRKIAVEKLFTNHQLDSSQSLRQTKVGELVEFVRGCCENGKNVDVGKAAFITTLNLLSNTFFSRDLGSYESSGSDELKDVVWAMMEIGAKPNVSDFFPVFRNWDLQGVLRKTKGLSEKMIGIFDRIIDERLSREGGIEEDDLLATLLKLVDDDQLSLDDVRHMLMDLFVAGTDTTSSTLEWAMTELLRNPETLTKAQDEIDQVIRKTNEPIQESDISKLPYIQAIVKETFRLHPPVPFLVPHRADKDVQLCNYLVPKNAQIWVNVWAIGRDPKVWANPLLFSPERFLGSGVDVKGRDFELLPFGSGRRVCPGMPLALRMLHLMLATLVFSSDWKGAQGMWTLWPGDIDVEEKFGVTLQKDKPLLANCTSRKRKIGY